VACSASFRGLVEQARRVARSDCTVLLAGETGTGKDRLARLIHDESDRREGSFVKVSCAAAVEDLFLSDLLGHERGAFTGAVERRAGWFEVAAGGTLFLDEIAETSPRTQSLILRVLEERRLVRLGGTEPVPVDVRVVCATNRALEALVDRGAFRADLYYRLRAIRLDVPPLRERPEDIDAIALAVLARLDAGRGLRLTAEALCWLREQPWPGNVRELENAIQSAAALSSGTEIGAEDIRRSVSGGAPTRGPSPFARETAEALAADLDEVLAGRRSLSDVTGRLEIRLLSEMLKRSGGDPAAAARLTGMPSARFRRLARRLGAGPGPTKGVKS
jgi:transcriptional regulator with GAF, ATPase, and Fis domain